MSPFLNNKRINNREEGGFTLIEVLVAMAILFWGVMAINQLNVTTIRANATTRRMGEATRLAKQKIEEFRSAGIYNIPMSGPNAGEVIGPPDMLVDRDYCASWPVTITCPDWKKPENDPLADNKVDLVLNGIQDYSLTDIALANTADHCGENLSESCRRYNANGESVAHDAADTSQYMFWRVWNVVINYPAPRMITARVYVFFRDVGLSTDTKGQGRVNTIRRAVFMETIIAPKVIK